MRTRLLAFLCVLLTGPALAVALSSSQAAASLLPADPARAAVETAPWTGGPFEYDGGDVSDDAAIYANPTTPADSLVIADNKSDGSGSSAGGIGVFSMTGQLLQFRRDGQIGNVDLRPFRFASGTKVLVGANRRDDSTMRFWVLDPDTRTLSAPVEATTLSTGAQNYGFCLGYTGDTLNAYVLHKSGELRQYRITESATPGEVAATQVRRFDVGGQSEGCVVDDQNGQLYIGEEDEGIWRYSASANGGSTRVRVASVGENGLTADVEGLALVEGANASSGYLLASSQGSSRILAYDRITGDFVRSFGVQGSADGRVDGVSSTDGLAASSADLGPGFADGALVVHDGANAGGATSNLKYVPLTTGMGDSPTPTDAASPSSTATATPSASASTGASSPSPSSSAGVSSAVAVEANASSYVDSAAPERNFGTSPALSSDGYPSLVASYLRFDLSPYAGRTLVSAQLRVRTTPSPHAGSTGSQAIREVASDRWSESGLTYANRPAVGPEIGTVPKTRPDTVYTRTLSGAAVQRQLGQQLSLSIDQPASARNGLDLDARSVATAANRPTLLLTFADEAPSAATPSATTSPVPSTSPSATASTSPSATLSTSASATPSTSPSATPSTSPSATPSTDEAAVSHGWGAPVFHDEFNYTGAPDKSLWSVYDSAGHAGNGVRSPAQVTVNGSALQITGLADGTTGGLSTSKATRGRTYGRWETRMRVNARDPEYHPVLILWPDAGRSSANNCMEIDYAESTSNVALNKFFLHYDCSGGQATAARQVDMTQWHNYAVEWTPDHVVGYLDGQVWFTDTDRAHVPDSPAHQTIQLDWFPDGTATARSWMQVDWWRMYPAPAR
ncbi:MAG TPA: phytase [Marmoricola sp.]|nr:phytase [Marmoricola sp.]